VIDQIVSDPRDFFRGLDLAVYCTPLNATLGLLEAHRGFVGPETLLTDVVSLKRPIMERAREVGLQASFVGSHPMCGGEGAGFKESRDGLFVDARVWIVAEDALPEHVMKIQDFWTSLGAEGNTIDASRHDALMATASHLPQLTANALALAMSEVGIRREDLGPGGRDMTRLSGSDPEMWEDLLEHSPSDLFRALESVEKALAEVRGLISEGRGREVGKLMRRTRGWFKGEEWS
jgi:prephenate dehydrogenase